MQAVNKESESKCKEKWRKRVNTKENERQKKELKNKWQGENKINIKKNKTQRQ